MVPQSPNVAITLADQRMASEDYQPISPRMRLLIVVLALSTAGTVMYSVLERPGLHLTRPVQIGADGRRLPPPRNDEPPRCSDGQNDGCVGGQAQVILVAPTATATLPSTTAPLKR